MPYADPSGVDAEGILWGSNPLKPPVQHDDVVLEHLPSMIHVSNLDVLGHGMA